MMKYIFRSIISIIAFFVIAYTFGFIYGGLYRRNSKMDYNVEMTGARLHSICEYLERIMKIERKYPIEEKQGDQFIFPNRYQVADGPENIYYYESYNSGIITNNMRFQYISNGSWFVLFGAGPDKKYEQDAINWISTHKDSVTRFSMKLRLETRIYDPTNGLISPGDIIITSKNLGMNLNYLGEKERLKIYY